MDRVKFNTPVHHTRPGIDPNQFYSVILEWHRWFSEVDVEFKTGDYKDLSLNSDDWLYVDPPYHGTSAIYHGGIDLEKFYDWLETVEAGFALSFDGRVGSEDQEIFIPDHLY